LAIRTAIRVLGLFPVFCENVVLSLLMDRKLGHSHNETSQVFVRWAITTWARSHWLRDLATSAQHGINRVSPHQVGTMKAKSNKLCVRVQEGEREVVSVRLPAATIGWIETLMPKHVLAKIEERDIDLTEIKRIAKERNLESQELFQLESGKRSYRVWLE
jgi:hypothetical protein